MFGMHLCSHFHMGGSLFYLFLFFWVPHGIVSCLLCHAPSNWVFEERKKERRKDDRRTRPFSNMDTQFHNVDRILGIYYPPDDHDRLEMSHGSLVYCVSFPKDPPFLIVSGPGLLSFPRPLLLRLLAHFGHICTNTPIHLDNCVVYLALLTFDGVSR